MGSALSHQVTELLARWNQGDAFALESLVPLVYTGRHIARQCLAGQDQYQSVRSTSLVHEAYLRLVHQSSANWKDRVRFFAVAARVMRNLLADHARRRNAKKRGGTRFTIALEQATAVAQERDLDLVKLNDALNDLLRMGPLRAYIVELRFFGGLSIEETSHALGISPSTVKRDWATARAWLYHQAAST